VAALVVPSDVRKLTDTVSADAFGFTKARAVIKPDVLSNGTRIRLDAKTAGAVESCARPPDCSVKIA
jgi:hypothetical protein